MKINMSYAAEPNRWAAEPGKEISMELCSISKQPYDECDGNHEGECVWQCGDCGGNVYNCSCPNPILSWALDPRRNGAQRPLQSDWDAATANAAR